MPGYRGHLIGGAITFAAVYATLRVINPESVTFAKDIFSGLVLCLAGSLFPDIDIKSVGQRIFYFAIFPILLLAILTKQFSLLTIVSLLSVIPVLVSHRGLIHKWWFLVFVPLLVPMLLLYNHSALVAPALISYVFFVSGALSHVLLDYGLWRFIKKHLFRS